MAEAARSQLGGSQVVFMPAAQPPHKEGQQIVAYTHRLEMLRLAIADNPFFTLSMVELMRQGPNYTIDTIQLLQKKSSPDIEFYFIIGLDSLRDFPTWHKASQLMQLVKLAVIARPGYQVDMASLEQNLPGIGKRVLFIECPLIGISSTQIRQTVRQGGSIRYLLPRPVERYIAEQGLYNGE
jgi:nicotinate-nucleotide adenylyltransferase